jgi:hypothetical protein
MCVYVCVCVCVIAGSRIVISGEGPQISGSECRVWDFLWGRGSRILQFAPPFNQILRKFYHMQDFDLMPPWGSRGIQMWGFKKILGFRHKTDLP